MNTLKITDYDISHSLPSYLSRIASSGNGQGGFPHIFHILIAYKMSFLAGKCLAADEMFGRAKLEGLEVDIYIDILYK